MLELLLMLLAAVSWCYWGIALFWTRAFFLSHPMKDLLVDSQYTPPVSILKPMKGLDYQVYENLTSFCRQDYPSHELLFGVTDPNDPALAVVEKLKREFPERNISSFVAPPLGMNDKVSILHYLAGMAHNDLLAISDSDMRVTPDYLRRVVAPLSDPDVGLVTCPYRGEDPATLTARLEALHMGATFLPSIIVARRVLSMRFALGATVVLRRGDLERAGGFAAIADYLADDYQLAAIMARLGMRVYLSDYVASSMLGSTTFWEEWDREVRWAQCNRVNRPREYPGILLTFSTPLALLLTVVSEGVHWPFLAVALALRWAVGWLAMGYADNRSVRRWLFWLPVRDMLSALIWCAGGVTRRVVWRRQKYALQQGGYLAPVARPAPRLMQGRCPNLLRRSVYRLDSWQRKRHRIFEFSQDKACLFRLSVRPSDSEVVLADGTQVHQGELVGELHLWNEHIPPMPEEGADLGWALAFRRQMKHSLDHLAAYIQHDGRLGTVPAFCGDITFGNKYEADRLQEVLERWGFQVVQRNDGASPWRRFASFWENLYGLLLIWTFNPGSLKGHGMIRAQPDRLWLSRQVLVDRFGMRSKKLTAGQDAVAVLS